MRKTARALPLSRLAPRPGGLGHQRGCAPDLSRSHQGRIVPGLQNDLWTLKLGQEKYEWKKPKVGQPDKAPSPRWRHTATLMRQSHRPTLLAPTQCTASKLHPACH